ncbi:DNA-3-methyladenine glycosylase I [Rhizobium sp. BK068]|nr:DNA-3-methyladenine glycosylase I [Rhizobium sp. BK068]
MSTTVPGPDGRPRCRWCAAAPELFAYHDHEWGFPVTDDIRLFEKLCLESFQSGLSWRTILATRENFRAAFDGFDFRKMALFDEAGVARLLADSGIVRHRGKIEAVTNNARRACELAEAQGSLSAFFWRFEANNGDALPQSRSTTPASERLSKEPRKRGWKIRWPHLGYFKEIMDGGPLADSRAAQDHHDHHRCRKQPQKRYSIFLLEWLLNRRHCYLSPRARRSCSDRTQLAPTFFGWQDLECLVFRLRGLGPNGGQNLSSPEAKLAGFERRCQFARLAGRAVLHLLKPRYDRTG